MGTILVDWLQAALRYAAPLLLVAVGEVFAERSGVINMGVEGIMLVGCPGPVLPVRITSKAWSWPF